ncbi:unnamed protein product [Lactuca saligna]|uniref:PGG domain-containing protein n=1 Tax=Lactuca saligna TaxID=75948 RepID=A0AA35YB79_LACSI|nr:unnamed protein product [Lactuca saligna]
MEVQNEDPNERRKCKTNTIFLLATIIVVIMLIAICRMPAAVDKPTGKYKPGMKTSFNVFLVFAFIALLTSIGIMVAEFIANINRMMKLQTIIDKIIVVPVLSMIAAGVAAVVTIYR